ncbi:MAG: lysylphosphatidylglycerol synthase domain-containing protein [Bacteroidales bacterium]|nr:lysylphosphatidylglycerol synthase domain-containing protein [Bacteroidales bacterium]
MKNYIQTIQNKLLSKTSLFILKFLVTGLAWWYIYVKLSSEDFRLQTIPEGSFFLVCLVLLLVFANWFIEARKWHLLILVFQKISFFRALKGALIGTTLGFITPNRIGDIGGRSVVLKTDKKRGMVATSIGSFMQLSATLLFGVLGIILFSVVFSQSKALLLYLCVACVGAMLVFFLSRILYKNHVWQRLLLRIIGKLYYRRLLQTVQLYSSKRLFHVFFLGIVRYLVFSFQYILLLFIFIPELSVVQSFVGITLTYLFVTLIPSSILGELGVRGSVSVFVFGFFAAPPVLVFQVSLYMWLINLAFPVFVGTLLLLEHRMFSHWHDN